MDAATRHHVRERAEQRCEYCRLPQTAAPYLTFHIEHIHATQHVVDDSLGNLCLACPHCNFHKGTNLASLRIETREIIPLFHPRQQAWDDHFGLAGATIIGRTNTGDVTVRLLKMNDGDQVEIRAGLILRGEF